MVKNTLNASEVKKIAEECGFDLAGICPADPLVEADVRLREWLARGYAGGMHYLGEHLDRRADPRKILPSARSVIVLGLNYFPGSHGEPSGPSQGRVAKYARGRDYHKVLDKKLRAFIRALTERLGRPFEARRYVDTGPVLERPLAARAGLGFTGKHTLLINRRFGSWIFLAELITDLELEFDKPDLRDCGTCTKCIDACPTGAIVEDYVLDASRCISYLTIENRGTIEPALREKMGDLVFGCDICQDVCPLNRRAEVTEWEGANGASGLWLELEEVLSIRSDEMFQAHFQGSPLKRSKREGLLRNAAVAAGNSGNKAFVPILEKTAAEDASELVREHAAWALRKLNDPACVVEASHECR